MTGVVPLVLTAAISPRPHDLDPAKRKVITVFAQRGNGVFTFIPPNSMLLSSLGWLRGTNLVGLAAILSPLLESQTRGRRLRDRIVLEVCRREVLPILILGDTPALSARRRVCQAKCFHFILSLYRCPGELGENSSRARARSGSKQKAL